MPERVQITASDELFSGVDKTLQFTVVDASDAAVNITGWALEWVLYQGVSPKKGATALITKTTSAGITITNGAGGVCQVAIADTDTDTIDGDDKPGYYQELRRTDAGLEDVLAYGPVTIKQSPRN